MDEGYPYTIFPLIQPFIRPFVTMIAGRLKTVISQKMQREFESRPGFGPVV